jgi:hypothetical protein
MKTVTVDDVMALGPCSRYDRTALKKLFGRRRRMTLAAGLALDIPAVDRLWVAIKGPWLDDRQRRLFAADCAERVLPLWEAKYPDDKRPRQTIEVARRYAEGRATEEERAAAWAAARAAAWAAAWDAARDDAWSAARDAAWAAAWSAARDAAWSAARDAAWCAARSAAWSAAGDAAWAAFYVLAFARIQRYAEGEE